MPYLILFLYFRKTLPWHVGCMPVQTLSFTSGPHSRRRCWVSCLELCHSSPSTSSSRQTGYVTSWIYHRWRHTRNDGCSTGHECNMTIYLLRAMYTLACKNLHKSIRRLYVNCCLHAHFIFSFLICCGDSAWFSSSYNSGRIWINHHNAALPILSLCWRDRKPARKSEKYSDTNLHLGKMSRRRNGCKVTVILFPWKLH